MFVSSCRVVSCVLSIGTLRGFPPHTSCYGASEGGRRILYVHTCKEQKYGTTARCGRRERMAACGASDRRLSPHGRSRETYDNSLHNTYASFHSCSRL